MNGILSQDKAQIQVCFRDKNGRMLSRRPRTGLPSSSTPNRSGACSKASLVWLPLLRAATCALKSSVCVHTTSSLTSAINTEWTLLARYVSELNKAMKAALSHAKSMDNESKYDQSGSRRGISKEDSTRTLAVDFSGHPHGITIFHAVEAVWMKFVRFACDQAVKPEKICVVNAVGKARLVLPTRVVPGRTIGERIGPVPFCDALVDFIMAARFAVVQPCYNEQ